MKLDDMISYAKDRYHLTEQFRWPQHPEFSVLNDPVSEKSVAMLIRITDPKTGGTKERCDLRIPYEEVAGRSLLLSKPFQVKSSGWTGIELNSKTDMAMVRDLLDQAMRTILMGRMILQPVSVPDDSAAVGLETPLPFGGRMENQFADATARSFDVPSRILQMRTLYDFSQTSPEGRAENFVRQARFMESYEENREIPLSNRKLPLIPTYHDLNIRELNAYFSWRTSVRKGKIRSAIPGFEKIYLFELINGIGPSGPDEILAKIKQFEQGYERLGLLDEPLKKSLSEWKRDLMIVHQSPKEQVLPFLDPNTEQEYEYLNLLKDPISQDDDSLFEAINHFAPKDLIQTLPYKKDAEKTRRLFAQVWKTMSAEAFDDSKDIFTACFDQLRSYVFRPFSKAVWKPVLPEDPYELELNPCHRFRFENDLWYEDRFPRLFFNLKLFSGIVHETQRVARWWLKTGHPLLKKDGEEWITPYVLKAIQQLEKQEKQEAAPAVSIDFSSLEQIRQDASVTRESLLTDEERMEEADSDRSVSVQQACADHKLVSEETPPVEEPEDARIDGLDPVHQQILKALLASQPTDELIRHNHLMPSIVADRINETLYDEIGDTMIEYDGQNLSLVEDYRDDVMDILGGNGNG